MGRPACCLATGSVVLCAFRGWRGAHGSELAPCERLAVVALPVRRMYLVLGRGRGLEQLLLRLLVRFVHEVARGWRA